MKKTILNLLLASASAIHAESMLIDLSNALLLADGQNTELAVQLKKTELAALEKSAAWYQWVPTLRVGIDYTRQEGALQDTSGNVSDAKRSSSYKGFGAGAAGSGIPARPGLSLNVDLSEAIYAPLAARQLYKASRFEGEALRLNVMLDVATAYYNLVRAARDVEITALSAENAGRLAKLTADFSDNGEGLLADAERAAVESLMQQQKLEAATEFLEAASIHLSRLLRLDETVQLRPVSSIIVPLDMIDPGTDLQDLFSKALAARPEIGENRAILEAEEIRLAQGKYGAFIPKLEMGYSYGNFGGASGTGSRYDEDRKDLYGMIYWQFESLGLRNINQVKTQRARIMIAKAKGQQARTDVLAEVKMARIEFNSAARQLDLVRRAVDSARKAFDLSNERIFENKGIPLEALQAMKALAESESLYSAVATKYNLSQLRIVSATGQGLRVLPE